MSQSTDILGKRRPPCTFEGCGKTFATKQVLKRHMYTHTNEKRQHQCTVVKCDKAYDTLRELKNHMCTHTGEGKAHPCPWSDCKKTFAYPSKLKAHMYVHTGQDRRFPCTWDGCNASFADGSHLAVHLRTHTGETPFKCTWSGCAIAFKSSSGLLKHTRVHTGFKPHKCTWPDCTKSFSRSDSLKTHTRTHTGERPFKCDVEGCIKAFAARSARIGHRRRVHTSDRPYKCTYNDCTRSFAVSSCLSAHMRTHTNERPYACAYTGCIKAFKTSTQRVTHHRIHSGKKPYACDIDGCDKAFTQVASFQSHKYFKHSDQRCPCGHARLMIACLKCNPKRACQLCFQFRGYKQTKGLCANCYHHKSGKRHIKEDAFNLAITDQFPDVAWIYDRQVVFAEKRACGTKRRPDWRIELPSHVLIIECDEKQHPASRYPCERKRLREIAMAYGCEKPVVVLRLNPDAYRESDNTRHEGCFVAHSHELRQAEFERRCDALFERIAHYLETPPTLANELSDEEKRGNLAMYVDNLLVVEHLFYTADKFDGTSAVKRTRHS